MGKSQKQIPIKVLKTHQLTFPLMEGPRQQETPVSLKKEGASMERENGRQARLKLACS